jgi:hypothetical protein
MDHDDDQLFWKAAAVVVSQPDPPPPELLAWVTTYKWDFIRHLTLPTSKSVILVVCFFFFFFWVKSWEDTTAPRSVWSSRLLVASLRTKHDLDFCK